MESGSLPHLETFVEAAERNSFTAAARYLRISQAAVSQRIQQLEGTLKIPLFRRGLGRLSLTDEGRLLHRYARRILALHDEAKAELRGKLPTVSGELRLASSSVPGEHILPPFLASFRDAFPKVRVRLTVADTAAVLRDVRAGAAQLGVVGGKDDHADLSFHPVATDRLALVVGPNHSLRRRRMVTIDQLLKEPFIQREAGSATRRCFEDDLRAAGHLPSELNVVIELGSNQAIKSAVSQGVGVAVLSANAVSKEANEGSLFTSAIKELQLTRQIFVVQKTECPLSPPAEAFLHRLRN